jgi:hypothetical protein
VVAAALFGLGAWLMRSTEAPPEDDGAEVNIPRRMTNDERKRNDSRQTWMRLPEFDAGQPVLQRPRDPVMAALPPTVKRAAVVVEANAIRNSELGDLMVSCLFDGDRDVLADFRDAGVDPLSQVDRLTAADDVLMASGDFKKADWRKLLGGGEAQGYGRSGELFSVPFGRDGGETFSVGTWNGQMLLMGPDQESIKATLYRLDGTGPVQPSVLNESQAWGEVYGVLMGGALADMVGEDDPRLSELLRSTAKNVELHVDVSHDGGVMADVHGENAAQTEDLRKAMGSGLALARMQAEARGRKDEAQVLDYARVHAGQGANFRLEAGLPHDFLKKSLEKCVERRKNRRARDAG